VETNKDARCDGLWRLATELEEERTMVAKVRRGGGPVGRDDEAVRIGRGARVLARFHLGSPTDRQGTGYRYPRDRRLTDECAMSLVNHTRGGFWYDNGKKGGG
jgi:hypothetical protein